MKSVHQFVREMFSEPNDRGSGKRLVGFIGMMVALFCVTFLVITEGCSACVEHLLEVIIISSCSLLGLTTITSIFKNKNNGNTKE